MLMEKRRTYVSFAEQTCMRASKPRLKIRCVYDGGLNRRVASECQSNEGFQLENGDYTNVKAVDCLKG
jgi:hypothetical protein